MFNWINFETSTFNGFLIITFFVLSGIAVLYTASVTGALVLIIPVGAGVIIVWTVGQRTKYRLSQGKQRR